MTLGRSTARAGRSLPLAPRGEEHHRTKGLLRLTMVCNERCPFCNVPMEDYPSPDPSDEALEAELQAFLGAGEQTLTISGGEPTLRRRRLLDIVRRARARVPFVELQTNAILIDDGYAEALAEAGLTSAFVSLLSDEAALHDELAGLSGAFAKCLRGIDALLAHGIAVTLNPVTARSTQDRLARYVDFVAARFPGIITISVSAVQPHGRAADAQDLMPDYDVLAAEVPRAQARAEAHGLVLVNPYCGLPLCVGWSDHADRSVEAIEATATWQGGAFGVDNHGNKRHGPPCRRCALRTRCGGAWHAYWDHRDGRGIAAPLLRSEPWRDDGDPAAQTVVRAARIEEAEVALAAARTPTVWWVGGGLTEGDEDALLASGATDVALVVDDPTPSLLGLIQLQRRQAERDEARRIGVVLGLTRLRSYSIAWQRIRMMAPVVDAVRLLVHPRRRHLRLVAAARERGLDVELAPP